MNRLVSRWLALGGIVVLIAAMWLPVPSGAALVLSAPLVILLLTGLRPPPRWGGWAAVTMIPYLCVAVGEVIVDAERRPTYALIVVCTLVVFFAAMDFVRKTRVSLRR